jgi:hypothetical protein
LGGVELIKEISKNKNNWSNDLSASKYDVIRGEISLAKNDGTFRNTKYQSKETAHLYMNTGQGFHH